MRAALTGGMGCGKTFVLSCFASLGWVSVDCDLISRSLMDHDADVARAVRERLGGGVFNASGKLDRKALAKLVFADYEALDDLERILFPGIRESWERALETAGNRPAIVEIPLLFEKNLEKLFDISVCVTAGRPAQIKRLAGRGFGSNEVLERMARQLPMQEKELRADFVISNNGNTDFTRAQVAQLAGRIV
jgi:dephospho-CoA kinase